MATYTAEALCLLHRKYRGTERVVIFFTRERGRVDAVARGVGKPGSSLAGAVELFAHSRVTLAEGRQLDKLTQARVLEAFEGLRADPVAYGYAGYLAELVARATQPGQALPRIFDALRAAFALLEAGADAVQVAVSCALVVLDELGEAPELSRCVRCDAAEGGGWYLPSDGGLVCPACRRAGEEAAGGAVAVTPAVAALTGTLRRAGPAILGRVQAPPGDWKALWRIVRLHVRHFMDLQMASEEYLAQMEGRA